MVGEGEGRVEIKSAVVGGGDIDDANDTDTEDRDERRGELKLLRCCFCCGG